MILSDSGRTGTPDGRPAVWQPARLPWLPDRVARPFLAVEPDERTRRILAEVWPLGNVVSQPVVLLWDVGRGAGCAPGDLESPLDPACGFVGLIGSVVRQSDGPDCDDPWGRAPTRLSFRLVAPGAVIGALLGAGAVRLHLVVEEYDANRNRVGRVSIPRVELVPGSVFHGDDLFSEIDFSAVPDYALGYTVKEMVMRIRVEAADSDELDLAESALRRSFSIGEVSRDYLDRRRVREPDRPPATRRYFKDVAVAGSGGAAAGVGFDQAAAVRAVTGRGVAVDLERLAAGIAELCPAPAAPHVAAPVLDEAGVTGARPALCMFAEAAGVIRSSGGAQRAGYDRAVEVLAGVVQRTGSPAARWAAEYLVADPDRLAPALLAGGGVWAFGELGVEELTAARMALLHRYWAVQHTDAAHRSASVNVNADVGGQLVVLRGLLARLMGCRPEEVPDGESWGRAVCGGCR